MSWSSRRSLSASTAPLPGSRFVATATSGSWSSCSSLVATAAHVAILNRRFDGRADEPAEAFGAAIHAGPPGALIPRPRIPLFCGRRPLRQLIGGDAQLHDAIAIAVHQRPTIPLP